MHHDDDVTARISAMVIEHLGQRVAMDDPPLDHSITMAEMAAEAPSLLTEHGNDPEVVFAQFRDVLAPRILSVDSPRFLSFIPAAPTKAALLFDTVVSISSLNGISWLEAAGAVWAENQVLEWLADLAGFPAGSGGCFVSGGSAANLSALAVARDVVRHRSGLRAPAPATPHSSGRWRIVVSDQSHSSIASASHLLDTDLLVVDTVDGRLTGDLLERAVAADGDPASVMAVVATAGTTNAGIVDDLAGIARVAAANDWWFHVDGAYGGAGILAPSVRSRYDGLEHADSFCVDPHKWLFGPFDCAALIYREPQLARATHTQDASYLEVLHERPEEPNPTDYAYHLTRRARGLPMWFSLAVHGTGAYREAVETSLALARRAARLIDGLDHVELVLEPELSVVVFRRIGWDFEDYQRWSRRMLDDQVAFVVPSRWRGEAVARFAFVHPDTTDELVAEILASMAC